MLRQAVETEAGRAALLLQALAPGIRCGMRGTVCAPWSSALMCTRTPALLRVNQLLQARCCVAQAARLARRQAAAAAVTAHV